MQIFALLHKRICNSIKISPLGGIVPSPDTGEDPAKVRRCNESPQANRANSSLSGQQFSQLRPSPERPLQCEAADDLGKGLGDAPPILRRPCLSQEPAHTFARDQFTSLKFDYIFANPPFNIDDWG